jgi:mitogen-activated protein kinase 1/3
MSVPQQPLKPPVPASGGKVIYTVQGQKFEIPKHFSVTKVVGAGAYGTVCAAVDGRTKQPVAIKKISRVFDDLTDCKRIARELRVLSFIKHTNLLRLREFIRPNHREAFDDVYIVTDLYDSDLHRIVKSQQPLTDEHLQYFMAQAFRGLHHLHSANILHRDLKPSNILINANCDIVICDFGLARGESSGELTEYVVTRWYRPPELLSLSSHYSTAVDIWSMGLIFAELLFGRTLLPGKDYVAQLTLVVDLLGTPTEEDMECLSEQARKFICAQPTKPARDFRVLFPKASSDGIDLLRQLLQFHPKRRLTTAQIFEHPYLSKFRDAAEEAGAPAKFEANIESNEGTTVAELRTLLWDEIVKQSDEVVLSPRKDGPSTPVEATSPAPASSEKK